MPKHQRGRDRKKQVEDWMTDERLERINHLRERSGTYPLNHKQAIKLMQWLDDELWREVKERIG